MKSLSQKYWIDKGSDTIPGTPIENNKPNPQQRSILVSPEIFIRSQEHIREVFTIEIEKDQTTISRHLKLLVDAGILKSEKKGRNIIYSIKDKATKDMLIKFGIDGRPCCKED